MRMHCKTHGGAFPREAYIRALEDSTWPRLEDLGFTGMVGRDTRTKDVVGRLPSLRRVQLDVKLFGGSCWSSFKSEQKESLGVLDLRGCYSFTTWWTLDVFTHFGHLEEFSTKSIDVADVKLYPRALSSFGLKKLEVFFISDPKSPDEDRAAFELLSNFEKLESIDVREEGELQVFFLGGGANIQVPVHSSLETGLGHGQLSKLKSLRRLVLDNRFQDMRAEDL